MRPKPAPQQRPEAFHRIHMHFTKAVPIVISGVLAPSMVDTLMVISPGMQAGINAVLICINQCTWNDRVFDEGFNRLLLHIGNQIDYYLATPLNHTKDRRPLFVQGATATLSFESTSTSLAALVFHHCRLAFMPRNHISFVALHLICQRHGRLFFTIP